MQRFFVQDYSLWNKEFLLDNKDIISQLVKVLRVKEWESIIFFDGKNLIDYEYQIKVIDKKTITCELVKTIEKKSENKYNLNLYQATPNKSSKVDYILQKWVETWISYFIFFKSERSQPFNISENKLERYKKIIIEACEQSWRNIIPEIKILNSSIISMMQWLQSLSMMEYKGWEWEKNLFHLIISPK